MKKRSVGMKPLHTLCVLLLVAVVSLATAIVPAAAQTTTVSTDKPIYLPGEVVTISGTVAPAQVIGVIIAVRDPVGTLVHTDAPISNSNGDWSSSFRVSPSARTGTYTAYATPSGGTQATTTFLVGQIQTVTVTVTTSVTESATATETSTVMDSATTTVTSTAVKVSSVTASTTNTVLARTTVTSVETVVIPEATTTIPTTRTSTTALGFTSVTRTETVTLPVAVTATETVTTTRTTTTAAVSTVTPRAATLTYTASTLHSITERIEKVDLLLVAVAFLIPTFVLAWLYMQRRRAESKEET